MIEISRNVPIATLIKEHPEIKDIMVEIGFEQITNPAMLKTAAKVMTIQSGCSFRKIDLDKVEAVFLRHGFKLM